MLPFKKIMRLLRVSVHLSPNVSDLVWVIVIKRNLFQHFNWFYYYLMILNVQGLQLFFHFEYCYIALLCNNLISLCFLYSVLYRELDQDLVGGGGSLVGVKDRSSNNGVVCGWVVNFQEAYIPC